ncbi:MAG: DUF542 domain-containing protein [Planctomycetaceae bacterium]|nr:DUF542 domain-containing protein [Planctomycetaceae bacterium]
MLIVTRKAQERIVIDGNIVITVVQVGDDLVRLGVEAPKAMPIVRGADTADVGESTRHIGTTPMNCDQFSSIPDWIIEYPASAAVFEEFGLDTSCGGKSLQYVCRSEGVGLNNVLARLKEVVDASN